MSLYRYSKRNTWYTRNTNLIENLFVLLERLLVVSEYYERNLECLINEKQVLTIEQIQQWTHQILHALIYLQERQLHTRNLSLKNIRLGQSVKTFQTFFIGLFSMMI